MWQFFPFKNITMHSRYGRVANWVANGRVAKVVSHVTQTPVSAVKVWCIIHSYSLSLLMLFDLTPWETPWLLGDFPIEIPSTAMLIILNVEDRNWDVWIHLKKQFRIRTFCDMIISNIWATLVNFKLFTCHNLCVIPLEQPNCIYAAPVASSLQTQCCPWKHWKETQGSVFPKNKH